MNNFDESLFDKESGLNISSSNDGLSHDTEQIRTVADAMLTGYTGVQTEAAVLQGKVTESADSWTGPAADAFRNAANSAVTAINNMNESLQASSKQTNTGADELDLAERRGEARF